MKLPKKISQDARTYLNIAVPLGAEQGSQRLFLVLEQVIVAHLGLIYMAISGLIATAIYILTTVLMPIATGTTVIVAQYKGAKNDAVASQFTLVCIFITAATAVLLSLGLIISSGPLLDGLSLTPAELEQGRPFFVLMLLSAPAAIIGSSAARLLRMYGVSRYPLLVTLGCLGAGCATSALAVGLLNHDPKVAAVYVAAAVFGAQFVRMALMLKALWPHFDISAAISASLEDYWRKAIRTMAVSLPLSAGRVLFAVALIVYTVLMSTKGADSLAIGQAIVAVQTTIVVLAAGIPVAGISIVGRAIGSGDEVRIHSSTNSMLTLTLVAGALFAVLGLVAAQNFSLIYTVLSDEQIISTRVPLLIAMVTIFLMVINMGVGGGIIASGADSRFIFANDFISTVCVGIPAALCLTMFTKLGLEAVFIGRACEEVSRIVLNVWRFRGGDWRRNLAKAA